MKIDDVSLTIFTWDSIPATRYHAGSFTQRDSNLGSATTPQSSAASPARSRHLSDRAAGAACCSGRRRVSSARL